MLEINSGEKAWSKCESGYRDHEGLPWQGELQSRAPFFDSNIIIIIIL